jgi:hypothetical protein
MIMNYSFVQGYPIQYVITDAKAGKQTLLFVNEIFDYHDGDKKEKRFLPKGNLIFRRYILDKLNIPFIEVYAREVS